MASKADLCTPCRTAFQESWKLGGGKRFEYKSRTMKSLCAACRDGYRDGCPMCTRMVREIEQERYEGDGVDDENDEFPIWSISMLLSSKYQPESSSLLEKPMSFWFFFRGLDSRILLMDLSVQLEPLKPALNRSNSLLPPSEHTGSEQSFSMVRSWLEKCVRTHDDAGDDMRGSERTCKATVAKPN